MEKLREQYEKEVIPALMKKFNYKSVMEVPKLDKIVINIGLGDVKENPKSLENAIKDMFIRHCTYLNKNADENVIEKWKGTLYTGTEEIYNRKSGYVYIQNHLGYRLLLTNVKFNGTEAGKNAEVSINLENIGFGNILKEKTTTKTAPVQCKRTAFVRITKANSCRYSTPIKA